MTELAPRRIRSFVLRSGRVTDAQERAVVAYWPQFGVDFAPTPLDPAALFGRDAPLVVEIGFGNGEQLIAGAMVSPERNHLGIEVHRAGVGRALLAVLQQGLDNVRISCHDAIEVLETQLPPASVDELRVYFPDPWHKKRHHKRRLVQAPFVSLAASRLVAGGVLRLATDWEPYAQSMLEVLGASAEFENLDPDGGSITRPADRIETRFERRGTRLGHGVHDLAFRRRRLP